MRRWRPGEGAQSGGEDADGLVDELFLPRASNCHIVTIAILCFSGYSRFFTSYSLSFAASAKRSYRAHCANFDGDLINTLYNVLMLFPLI
ncbi:hypothetical protein IE989_07335 [Klebsiella pneumoniae]|nr:hypothetical protein [Klebsiella pneumoniae]